ncbi:Choline-sulfatase [Botrimarina colliarenosi]|uniref:Choline-sulfatase n=1 Tax=Botrimarina colliarenosi TaxID=2528001 RepID=A0A5C6A5Q4_9BACT|nr:sulfatase-like hydrolase/transferase [Botrimarina colliarenosi]TWT94829.1 Choline-sulfatase [Botrimarina colliarenosi]
MTLLSSISRRWRAATAIALLACPLQGQGAAPNIVMVAIDDLNDFVGPLRGAEDVLPDAEIRARLTPNLTRLAEWGATFTNAQTAHPACNASRAAIMSGVSGETTGLTANDGGLNWRNYEATRYATTLPQHLKNHGYVIETTGKVWHNNDSDAPDDRRDDAPADRAATDWDTVRPYHQRAAAPHRVLQQEWPIGRDRAASLRWSRLVPRSRGDEAPTIEAWEELTDSLDDQRAAAWTAERISSHAESDPPRFLATGVFHPHLPWDAPGVFFDRFPIDKIKTPKTLADDLADLGPLGKRMGIRAVHKNVLAATPDSDLAWRTAIQAYLASVSYADFAVGKILDAVEAKNTDDDPANDWIVVLWSDHGWHLGEKRLWHKFTVWEEAARSNLMVYAPGLTKPGERIDAPVELLAIAPTLCELAGVAPLPQMQDDSLLPLIARPASEPGAVALTSFGETEKADAGLHAKKYSLRSQRFRLVHYEDGSQELYDHDHDPDEFFNLLHPANEAEVTAFGLNASQVDEVRRWLGSRLFERLLKLNSQDVFVDHQVDLAAIETSGRTAILDPTPQGNTDFDRFELAASEDFLVAADVELAGDDRRAELRFGVVAGEGAYALALEDGGASTRLLRYDGDKAETLGEATPLATDARPNAEPGGSFRLLVDYAAATRTVELLVQDRYGVNRLRTSHVLSAALPADSGFAVRVEGEQGGTGVTRAVLLAEPAAPFPGDFNGDGLVNAADSTVWRDQLGKVVPVGSSADGDFDGRVEDDDRSIWTGNYGRKAVVE